VDPAVDPQQALERREVADRADDRGVGWTGASHGGDLYCSSRGRAWHDAAMTESSDPKGPARRFDYVRAAAGGYRAMLGLESYLHTCGLEPGLIELVKLRVSQINGCAYCIDMHWKDLRALGETEQRLYALDAWHECGFYTARERAALRWAEAVTRLADGHVPDEVYREVSREFDEPAISNLTLVISTINAWNRLAIAARTPAGSYQPTRRTS
jgi:AhpD family alkylhydroperoxidase